MGGYQSKCSLLIPVKQKVKEFILLCASSRRLTMVEVYSYPLLVGFGETNIPRLEIMLVKYFSSGKSAGGDCEIEYENGSSTAVVRFRREEGKFGTIK